MDLAPKACRCGREVRARMAWTGSRYEYQFYRPLFRLPGLGRVAVVIDHCPACRRRLVYRDLRGVW